MQRTCQAQSMINKTAFSFGLALARKKKVPRERQDELVDNVFEFIMFLLVYLFPFFRFLQNNDIHSIPNDAFANLTYLNYL